jgi:hypothetical protein
MEVAPEAQTGEVGDQLEVVFDSAVVSAALGDYVPGQL